MDEPGVSEALRWGRCGIFHELKINAHLKRKCTNSEAKLKMLPSVLNSGKGKSVCSRDREEIRSYQGCRGCWGGSDHKGMVWEKSGGGDGTVLCPKCGYGYDLVP